MSPKAGTPVSLVAPPEPIAAVEAATDAAGQLESFTRTTVAAASAAFARTTLSSSSSSSSSSPAAGAPPPAHEPDPAKKSWIEIVLKDEEGTPQGGTRYRVTLPDGSIAEGTLDAKGQARVDGFDPGSCKVTFPDLDQKTWKEK